MKDKNSFITNNVNRLEYRPQKHRNQKRIKHAQKPQKTDHSEHPQGHLQKKNNNKKESEITKWTPGGKPPPRIKQKTLRYKGFKKQFF